MLADLILSSYWRLRRVVVAEGGMIVPRALTVARERGAASALGLAAFDAAQLPTSRDVERSVRYQSLLTLLKSLREIDDPFQRAIAVAKLAEALARVQGAARA